MESNNNRICIYLKDNNNKENTMCSDAYKLDKTAPVIGTFNIVGTLGSNGWYTSDVTISANVGSDSLSGHNSSSVNISSITSNTTGTTVTLTTTDNAGNISSTTAIIKVDKTVPTIPSITYNSGSNTCSWKNNYNLTFDSSALSGIDYYEIDVTDDGIADAGTVANFIPGNGWSTCIAKFRAVSNSGLRGGWTEPQHIHMDTTAPTLTNWWWGEVTKDVARLYIQASDTLSGINRVQCPTSTASGSYNNWYWFNAVWDSGANAYRCDITPSTFGHYNQTYATHLYMYDNADNGGYVNATSVNIPIAEYADGSGANKPELFNNMIPVTYNGSNWIYADTTTEWYNYDNKQWANAVVLNTGVTKSVGNTILESEISLWYVWIPRYKYTVFNGNNGAIEPQEINVTFESGTNSTGTVTCNDNIGVQATSETCSAITNNVSTYTHPAFCLGHRTNGVCSGTELTGIWVGKFKNSTARGECINNEPLATNCNVISDVIIRPNKYVWTSTQIAVYFYSIKNIESTYGITNGDSHMIKNMEWGAIAYLTHSKYGQKIVQRNDTGHYKDNNISAGLPNFETGCGPISNKDPYNLSTFGVCNRYNTAIGMTASTTGNIYGIYDMNGAAMEYVMGSVAFSSTNPIVGYSSTNNGGFSGTYFNGNTSSGYNFPDYKYIDLYSNDKESEVSTTRGKLGDATKETLLATVIRDTNPLSINYGTSSRSWHYTSGSFMPGITSAYFARSLYEYSRCSGVAFYYGGAVSNERKGSQTATRSVLTAR